MRNPASFLLVYTAVAIAAGASSDQPRIIQRHPNEITQIPGLQRELESRHYGGYVTVDDVNKRHLYYYFVTSQEKPASNPLVLWLNGGPGCSSFDGVLTRTCNSFDGISSNVSNTHSCVTGFIYEHGPFEVSFAKGSKHSQDGRLVLNSNPYSWSKSANIIYLDSPAGEPHQYQSHQITTPACQRRERMHNMILIIARESCFII